jgi:ABC-type lipoprotein export system ATPase subunit
MDSIQIRFVVPHFLSDAVTPASEVWRNEVTFRKGEHCLVAAHSGSGKSSLLAYVFGERSDYDGDVLFDNRKTQLLKAQEWNAVRQGHISFVFQGLRLFPTLTAMENIAIKNRLTGYKTRAEILALLDAAGLADKTDEKAGRLSFGQQQRVAIIRALCQPFDFLLADEPFSHLDDVNTGVMAEIIAQELQRQGAGMILCSLGPQYPFAYQHHLKL